MFELFRNGHLTPDAFALFSSGNMRAEDTDALLAHASDCSRCALALAECLEKGPLISPPASFLEDTMRKIGSAGTQPGRQYYLYCLRVGLAVCASLVLVFSGVLDRFPGALTAIPAPEGGIAYTQRLTDGMRNFSDKLIKLEVFNNDEQTR